MIIVKTKEGTNFINDKTFDVIAHDKEVAKIYCGGDGVHSIDFENVESVQYVNDAQPFEYKDDGLELETIKKKLQIYINFAEVVPEYIRRIFDLYRRIGLGAYEFEYINKDEIEDVVKVFNKEKDDALKAWVEFCETHKQMKNELERTATD